FETHKPTVDDEPSATTFSRAPDFSLVSVRGSLAAMEMFELAARHVCAGDRLSGAWPEVELDKAIGSTIKRPNTPAIWRIQADQSACPRERGVWAICETALHIILWALVI